MKPTLIWLGILVILLSAFSFATFADSSPDTQICSVLSLLLGTCDSDRDGVPNKIDICPGFNDAVDKDGDAIPDGCDTNPADGPFGDEDNDGVDNQFDQCPGFNDKRDVDRDGIPNGCDADDTDGPLGDSDGDGFRNFRDICPFQPGPASGCPVQSTNDPPVIQDIIQETNDQEIYENELWSVLVIATDSDSDPLTYHLSEAPVGMTIYPDGRISWVPTYDQAGEHSVTVKVSDGEESVTESFILRILNVNRAPTINPIEDIEFEEGSFVIRVTASDPDGDILRIRLTVLTLPEGATFVDHGDNTATLTFTPNFEQNPEYNFIFTVDDGQEKYSEGIVITGTSLTINEPPVFGPFDDEEEIEVDEELTFTITAIDPDGDDFIFSQIGDWPEGATLINVWDETTASSTGQFSWTPTADQVGEHQITIGVTDNQENINQQTITILVSAAEDNNNGSNNNNQTNNNNNQQPLGPEQQEYNQLLADFDAFEEDYSFYKSRYEDAVDDHDQNDIDRYADKLEDLDGDLEDFEDDVKDFIEDVEDNDAIEHRNQLLDDLEELEDDVQRLQERITDLLHGNEEPAQTTTGVVNYLPPPTTAQPRESTRVIVETLDFPGRTTPPAVVSVEEAPSGWENVRPLALVSAGIVILIAVIIFFIALLIV